MTSNQISYYDYLERKRANTVTAEIRNRELAESTRHNLATENIQQQDANTRRDTLSESTRHNFASENLSTKQFEEQARHNYAGEDLSAQQNYINQRRLDFDSKVQEYNERVKDAQLRLDEEKNIISRIQQRISQGDLDNRQRQLVEQIRQNERNYSIALRNLENQTRQLELSEWSAKSENKLKTVDRQLNAVETAGKAFDRVYKILKDIGFV